jgi:two-component system, chemotaxis family, chemotaxis protein CheY
MYKVLIVDDTIFMRNMLKDIVKEQGYEVIGEASTGLEAIDMFKAKKPDMVLMDISMPEMDGISALYEIKNYDKNAVIIICSAMGQESMVSKAIKLGAKDFIVKPFKQERVIEALEKASHQIQVAKKK